MNSFMRAFRKDSGKPPPSSTPSSTAPSKEASPQSNTCGAYKDDDSEQRFASDPSTHPLSHACFLSGEYATAPAAGSISPSSSCPRQNSSIGAASSQHSDPRSMPRLSSPAAQEGGGSDRQVIMMDYGDIYNGEVTAHPGSGVIVPHGQGTLQSPGGKHCYVGNFHYQQRDGDGKLVTDRFALWGKWRGNRPLLTSSVRVDFPNGNKYAGYVAAMPLAGSSSSTGSEKNSSAAVSKFTSYVNSTCFVKAGWGELAYNDGARYFGQWHNDQPHGFGASLSKDGQERYIGLWCKGQWHGSGVLFHRNGCIYDGEWNYGAFQCVEGEVLFPVGHVKIRADFDDIQRFKNGTVIPPERRELEHRWRLTSLWEPLLGGQSEASRKRAFTLAAPMRKVIEKATTTEAVAVAVSEFINTNDAFINAIKIVRRIFYFYFGTCGHSSQRGGGQKGNTLGWCYYRKTYGGCIHRSTGDCVTPATLSAALGDVMSYVVSARRWLLTLIGDQGKIVIDAIDCHALIMRLVLDALLPLIHRPLLNLYIQTSALQQQRMDLALERLKGVSMDDIGVSFGRNEAFAESLFTPYADAINSLKNSTIATTLVGKMQALKKWSSDIDQETKMNQIKLHDEELRKVSDYIYMKREQQRRKEGKKKRKKGLKNLSTRASMTGEMVSTASLARSLPEGEEDAQDHSSSSDFDDEQQGLDSVPFHHDVSDTQSSFADRNQTPSMPNESFSGLAATLSASGGKQHRVLSKAFSVVAGSADDLFPIHQYVVLRGGVAQLAVHAKMIADFSAIDWLLDPTSQDSFCATTLQACVSLVCEMYPCLRDAGGIMIPIQALVKRVEDELVELEDVVTSVGPATLRRAVRFVASIFDRLGSPSWTEEEAAAVATKPSKDGAKDSTKKWIYLPSDLDESHQQWWVETNKPLLWDPMKSRQTTMIHKDDQNPQSGTPPQKPSPGKALSQVQRRAMRRKKLLYISCRLLQAAGLPPVLFESNRLDLLTAASLGPVTLLPVDTTTADSENPLAAAQMTSVPIPFSQLLSCDDDDDEGADEKQHEPAQPQYAFAIPKHLVGTRQMRCLADALASGPLA